MRYYTTKYKFCQEKGFTKMDDPDISTLRSQLLSFAENCNDIDLLYLIYTLLVSASQPFQQD
jgi:hypothetical protein